MRQTDINKEIVQNFYEKVLGEKDTEYASKIVTKDYIQHNPTIETGRTGLLRAIDFLKQLPEPNEPSLPCMRMIADGDYVAAHLNIELMGQKKSIVDFFRLENGLLAEHWDAIMDSDFSIECDPNKEKEESQEGCDKVRENKAIVTEYVDEVLINRKFDLTKNFISANFLHHTGDGTNRIHDLINFYHDISIDKVHRILGEGDFVFTQSSGQINREKCVIYDIYKLGKKKIVQQWFVFQLIPEKMGHGNGMI